MFGDGFLKLIKMLIVLIVFFVVVVGICGVGELKKVGCVGGKVVIYFEIVMMIVLVLGIVLVYLFGLGYGMNVDLKMFDLVVMVLYMMIVK